MTSVAPIAGALEVAAALAFHLPGARLDLSGSDGTHCSVGPLTDPKCQLHPAEFRELVVATGASALLASMLGCSLDSGTRLSLASPEGVDHVGGGLYRVASGESVSFAFVTTLEAKRADAVISSRYIRLTSDEGSISRSSGDDEEEMPLALSLTQDEGLGVTLVVINASEGTDPEISGEVAECAMYACLVAELEDLTADPDKLT